MSHRVIARNKATKQSPLSRWRRLLRFARNDSSQRLEKAPQGPLAFHDADLSAKRTLFLTIAIKLIRGAVSQHPRLSLLIELLFEFLPLASPARLAGRRGVVGLRGDGHLPSHRFSPRDGYGSVTEMSKLREGQVKQQRQHEHEVYHVRDIGPLRIS